MDVTTFIVAVYRLIDEWLTGQHQRLRRRGPAPTLADSAVLTMECVGEFLGIDTDSGIYAYFRRYWGEWFPGLQRVHRTTFAGQAANLWAVKQRLHQHLLGRVQADPAVALVDSVAIPICRFAPRRPLPAAAGAGRLGPRRGRQADLSWPARPPAGALAGRDRRRPAGGCQRQ